MQKERERENEEGKKERWSGGEKETDFSFIGSLPEYLQQPGLARANPRSLELLLGISPGWQRLKDLSHVP